MDWTPIVVSLVTVAGSIFASNGFWSWRTEKKSKNRQLFEKVTRINERVDDIKQEVSEIKKENGQDRAVTSRVRILRFEDELQENRHHSKDSFDQVMKDIKDYRKYVDENADFENGITEPTCKHIEAVYYKRLQKHDWGPKAKEEAE